MYTKQNAPYSAKTALYGALFKIVDEKKGAPPGGTKKPGGDMNISKSDIQGQHYYITSQAICQAPRKKTPDRSRAFSPKGVKQESHTVKGNRPATAHYGAAWQKKYWRLPNSYVSKYIIPHIRRNVKMKSLILHGFKVFFIRLDSAKNRVKSPVFSS